MEFRRGNEWLHGWRGLLRSAAGAGLVLMLLAVTAAAASAHGDEAATSSRELVQIAIGILEVHPVPEAAVEDKIADAQESEDQSGVDIALVKQAGEALDRGDVAETKRLLDQSTGECPDADVLYVNDQPAKPPCIVSAHELSQPRRSVGGTSEIVILIIAAILAIAGLAVIRHPFVRRRETSAS